MTVTPRKRIYHFSYLRQPADAVPRIHELRDGDAFVELQPALLKLGYEVGGLILNQPPEAGSELLPRLTSEDLVVLTTRPPIDDDRTWAGRKWIERTDSDLERAILKAARPVFAKCERPMIRLAEKVACNLPPLAVDRAEVEFRVYRRGDHHFAYYIRLRNPYGDSPKACTSHAPTNPKATAAFLLRTSLGPGGPTLLNAFGMDSVTTLIWCYLLRTKYAHLLDTPGFTMAEIDAGRLPARPLDLSFADHWQVHFLLAPGASPAARPRKRDSSEKRISFPKSIGVRSSLRS